MTPETMTDLERLALSQWADVERTMSPGRRSEFSKAMAWVEPTWEGEPGFLPMGGPLDGFACSEMHHPVLRCSREPGHDGDHANHCSPRLMVARWPQQVPS